MQKAVQRDGSHLAEDREVQWKELGFEFMLNALRLKEGVERSSYIERTGQSILAVAPALERAIAKGLLDPDPARLRATPQGWEDRKGGVSGKSVSGRLDLGGRRSIKK